MRWTPKIARHKPRWLQFESGVEIDWQAPESVKVRCQWRPAVMSAPSNFVCGLYLHDMRVFAVDLQPDKRHKNPAIEGLPYSGQRIIGVHRHIWTEFRDAYAEPIESLTQKVDAWGIFCEGAGILEAPFVDPDRGDGSGQISLL